MKSQQLLRSQIGLEPYTKGCLLLAPISKVAYALHLLPLNEEARSGRRDLNPQPQPWQGYALPLSYFRQLGCPSPKKERRGIAKAKAMEARLSPCGEGAKVFSRRAQDDNLIDYSEERAYYLPELALPPPYSFEGMGPY
ncbi:hypothetical protein KY285_023882 [Solanum tuberosum]|nr:hypothetical protein KY289_024216 [Solanum tuberosum]KAH0676081.1 hypothetical protein KY285_023882 [Solanum tuberosum]